MPGGDQARTAVPNMVDSLAITSDIGKEGVIPCQAALAEDYHLNSIASKQPMVRMSSQTSINLSVNANFDQKCHDNAIWRPCLQPNARNSAPFNGLIRQSAFWLTFLQI